MGRRGLISLSDSEKERDSLKRQREEQRRKEEQRQTEEEEDDFESRVAKLREKMIRLYGGEKMWRTWEAHT